MRMPPAIALEVFRRRRPLVSFHCLLLIRTVKSPLVPIVIKTFFSTRENPGSRRPAKTELGLKREILSILVGGMISKCARPLTGFLISSVQNRTLPQRAVSRNGLVGAFYSREGREHRDRRSCWLSLPGHRGIPPWLDCFWEWRQKKLLTNRGREVLVSKGSRVENFRAAPRLLSSG
jgi:hypothetical protein